MIHTGNRIEVYTPGRIIGWIDACEERACTVISCRLADRAQQQQKQQKKQQQKKQKQKQKQQQLKQWQTKEVVRSQYGKSRFVTLLLLLHSFTSPTSTMIVSGKVLVHCLIVQSPAVSVKQRCAPIVVV